MQQAYTLDQCEWLIMRLCANPPSYFYFSPCLLKSYRKDLTDCPFPIQHLGKDYAGDTRIAILLPRQYLIHQIQQRSSFVRDVFGYLCPIVLKRDRSEPHMFNNWSYCNPDFDPEPATWIHFEKQINSDS